MRLGAHVSTAGGADKAPANAEAIGAECMQIFTRNQNRWSSPPITAATAERYRAELERTGVHPVLAHDSYLVNLAATDPDKAKLSVDAFVDELARAGLLGIQFLVTHPGAHLGAGVEAGLARFTDQLDHCLDLAGPDNRVVVLLETTAGQGSCLGFELSQLRDIIGRSRHPDRLGVCADTCHLLASGYDLATRDGYERTAEEIAATIGLERLRAWHLNDSKKGLGSRVDRHADLGEGAIGLPPFRWLVNDPRWADLPGCLETPVGPEGWAEQLTLLKGMRDGEP